jgi:purine-binding chemotaxis protein CheW
MTDSAKRMILFSVEGETFALRLEDVAEVMEPPPIYPIPRVPELFAGIMNFHGNLVSVVDLARLLKNVSGASQGQLLVLDTRVANLALRVESVESVSPAEVLQEERESGDPLMEKELTVSGRGVKMLSVEKLLGRLEGMLTETGRNSER